MDVQKQRPSGMEKSRKAWAEEARSLRMVEHGSGVKDILLLEVS